MEIGAWLDTLPRAPATPLLSWAQDAMDRRAAQGLVRITTTTADGSRNFSGNDYLGLSVHPQVVAAAHAALETWGLGPRASPNPLQIFFLWTRSCAFDGHISATIRLQIAHIPQK